MWAQPQLFDNQNKVHIAKEHKHTIYSSINRDIAQPALTSVFPSLGIKSF